MCSIGDESYEELGGSKYLPTTELNHMKLTTYCNKCKLNEPSIVLRQKDAYCKDCFLSATTHKFKAFLGKHRLVFPNDKVLILSKEGHECAALLHFIRSGLDLNTPKKLKFQPIIIYIERNFSLNIKHRLTNLENINAQANHYNFDIYFISLLNCFDLSTMHLYKSYLEINLSNDDNCKLIDKLKDIKNRTQKVELLKLLERKLLYKISTDLGCRHIFTPELGCHVAAELLSNISLGRGIHLPLDIGAFDNRDPQVTIMRPLRHFEMKEIALYNHFNDAIVVNLMSIPHVSGTIQDVMKRFIDNLQNNFPATVTTIVRTGDKLALDDQIKNNPICKLCKGPIENNSTQLSAAESTMFSSLVSNLRINNELKSEEAYAKTIEIFDKSHSVEYCYTCLHLQHASAGNAIFSINAE